MSNKIKYKIFGNRVSEIQKPFEDKFVKNTYDNMNSEDLTKKGIA